MAIQKIIRFPLPSLREPCRPVEFPLSAELLEHIGDLKDTLAATPHGVALASNQILPKGHRVFVLREDLRLQPVPSMQGNILQTVVINPRWEAYVPHEIDTAPRSFRKEWLEEHNLFMEGCLSIPEYASRLKREYWVECIYQDTEGKWGVTVCQGLAARIVQHECDHLDGRLVLDYADTRTRARIKVEAINNRRRGR